MSERPQYEIYHIANIFETDYFLKPYCETKEVRYSDYICVHIGVLPMECVHDYLKFGHYGAILVQLSHRHYLSVSDVVVIRHAAHAIAYYVDDNSFLELPIAFPQPHHHDWR